METSTVRMDDLATLPVFFKLRDKRVILAGGDLPAVWKAELLAATGARVEVFAAHPAPEMVALAADSDGRTLVLIGRGWQPGDLVGAALAIGAVDSDAEGGAFREAAKQAGVPVNVVDRPAFCDFQFGTVVARSPLVIGISTDGAAPVFGQALRARIEAILPQTLRLWAQAAKDWRPAVQARELDFRSRRRFWEIFTARALMASDHAPTGADLDACLAAVTHADPQQGGRVTFVGCGQTAGSLTLDAVAALQSADIVAYDSEIAGTVVGFARREASKVPLSEDETSGVNLLADAHRQTRHAVWLGLGDPTRDEPWATRRAAMRSRGVDPILIQSVSGGDRSSR